MASIDESSTDNESDDRSISTNALEDICYESQINPDITTIDARLKICDGIKETQIEWKVAELSVNSMVKGLHKVYNVAVD